MEWSVAEFTLARWITADDRKILDQFVSTYRASIAEDLDGDLVFLARNAFNLDYTAQQSPGITFQQREGHPGAQEELIRDASPVRACGRRIGTCR